ncbi:hypothetical protein [Streptomyces lydicus]|uniref:hypothetical protein n=1 Tax=Streptomyces lydicus TaxID=47763 RepID=UPI0037BBDC3F
MEIYSTPFDVLVRKGVVGRMELTCLVEVATRSVTAAVLRATTKSVELALLLACSVTPAPMRTGWAEALRLERSAGTWRLRHWRGGPNRSRSL